MAIRTTIPGRLGSPALLALVLASALEIPQAQAGPLVRRYQERQACQQFAGKLQAVSGNPQQAQYVYQQGVLKLVKTFGENPCTDIPAPTAAAPTVSSARSSGSCSVQD
jgi:sulfite reductase alpha subunit-like flavoprotein